MPRAIINLFQLLRVRGGSDAPGRIRRRSRLCPAELADRRKLDKICKSLELHLGFQQFLNRNSPTIAGHRDRSGRLGRELIWLRILLTKTSAGPAAARRRVSVSAVRS